jgi:hypothetical protein
VKVTRSAVVNAASIARMVLTTESAVVDKPEPPAPAPAHPRDGRRSRCPSRGRRRASASPRCPSPEPEAFGCPPSHSPCLSTQVMPVSRRDVHRRTASNLVQGNRGTASTK